MAAFDDLIPSGGAQPAPAAANAFADLIPAKPKSAMDYASDVARSVANGVPFADEIRAVADTIPGIGTGKSYSENIATEKAKSRGIPSAIKIPGEMAGAAGTAILTAPLTGAASAATGLAKLPWLIRGILGSGVADTARAVGTGAAAGALYGASAADPGLESRLEGAAGGAALGGAAGGVIGGIVAPVVRGVASGVRNVVNPGAQAGVDLGRALTRDNMTAPQYAQNVLDAQALRPGVATGADALGPNGQTLLERIAQTPGAGMSKVVPTLTDRQKQQAARLTMDLGSLTGSRKTALEATNEAMDTRAQQATPLYKEAFNFNARQVPEIVQAFNKETSTGYGKKILNSDEFKNTLQTEYGIANPQDAPLMVVIDAWKKAADDVRGSALKAGNNNVARVVKDMTGRVVNMVDQFNPTYAQARKVWGGTQQYLDAINDGTEDILSKKIGADEVAQKLAGMSDSAREGYTVGALGRIFREFSANQKGQGYRDFTQYIDSKLTRDKIGALMPTPEARDKFNQLLDFEVGLSGLTQKTLGNSATYRRQAAAEDRSSIQGDIMKLALSSAVGDHGGLLGFAAKKLGAAQAGIRDTTRARSDSILADVLTNPNANPDDIATVLRAAQKQQRGPTLPTSVVTNPAIAGIEGAQ